MSFIFYPLFSALWHVIRLFLRFFKFLGFFFQQFAFDFPFYVLFGTSKVNLTFEYHKLPELFLRFLIMSLLLLFIFSIWAYIKDIKDSKYKFSFARLMVNSLKYYFFFFVFALSLPVLMEILRLIYVLTGSGDSKLEIEKQMFNALKPEEISIFEWRKVAENDYDISYDLYSRLESPSTLIVMGIFAVFVPAILLSLTVISIISKIFQLLLLFVLSPWINAYRVLDDGENVRKWWMMFSAKLNSIWIYLIVLQLYIFFINKVMSFIDSLQESFITLAFYRIIGVLGATVSFNAAGEIINSFFGDNLSLREGMSQIQQTAQLSRAVKGGVAIAGGIAAKTIIGGVKLPSKIKAGVGFAQNSASNIRAFGTNLKNMKQQFAGVRQQFGQYREMLDQQGLNKSDKKSILNMMKQDKKDMYKSILTNPFKNNQLNKQMRNQELRNLYENNIKNLNTPSEVNNQLGEVDAD